MDPADPDDDLEGPRVLSGAEVASSTMVVKGGPSAKAKVFLQRSSNSSSDDVENSENDEGRMSWGNKDLWNCTMIFCCFCCQERSTVQPICL